MRAAAALLVLTLAPSALAAPTPKIADENGTPVTITSSHVDTQIFLAKGPVPAHPEIDPFEEVGVAPLDIKLAPGIYTIETVGPTQSVGHETFTVDRWPMKVDVHTGDSSVKTIGTILIATGAIAILAGIVVVASFGRGDTSAFDKYTVAIPMLIGGAAGAVVGVGMTFLGATNVYARMPSAPNGAALTGTLRF